MSILEKQSGLKFNIDFYCGYSPERINPGDKKHTIDKITIDKQININPIGNKAKGSFMNPFSSTSLPMSSNETKLIIPITSKVVAILYLVAICY